MFAAIAVPYLVLSDRDTESLAVFGVALGCAALGFADDYIKITKRRSLGLSARWKLLVQIALAVGAVVLATRRSASTRDPGPRLRRRATSGRSLYVVLSSSSSPARRNAVNLTDGLDGLAAGSCAIVFLAYTAITITSGQEGLAMLSACLVGASVGFLWFNAFPASIFMGDTGSLGLGGGDRRDGGDDPDRGPADHPRRDLRDRGALGRDPGVRFKTLPPPGLPDGPVHHHFELLAWSETKIMLRFWIVAAVCAGIGYTLFQNSIG